MPITKQAIKKLRHDRKRTAQVVKIKELLRGVIKAVRTKPTEKTLSTAFTSLDKAANKHIIHKNKAARLKSRLAKLLPKK